MMGMPLLAQSQSTFEEGGLLYMEDLSNPSKLSVIVMPKNSPLSGYKSLYSGKIVVPSTINHDLDTYEVVGIAQNAFFCDNLESLIIEEGVKTIAQFAINSQSLKLLQLPSTVNNLDCVWTMGADVKFGELSNTELNFIQESFPVCNSEKLKVIGNDCKINHSFLSCPNLKELELIGVKSIKDSFLDLPELEILKIGKTCENLENFTLMGQKVKFIYFEGTTTPKVSKLLNYYNTWNKMPSDLSIIVPKGSEGEYGKILNINDEFKIKHEDQWSIFYIPDSGYDEDDLQYEEDRNADFPGGYSAMAKWIKENTDSTVRNLKKTGIIHIKASVNKDGTIEPIEFTKKSSYPELNDEAWKLVKNMPIWNPAIKDGRRIKSTVNVIVRF